MWLLHRVERRIEQFSTENNFNMRFIFPHISAIFTAAKNRPGWSEKQNAASYPGDGHVPGARQHDDGRRRFALNGATYAGSGAIDGHACELQRRAVHYTAASRGRPGYQIRSNKTSKGQDSRMIYSGVIISEQKSSKWCYGLFTLTKAEK